MANTASLVDTASFKYNKLQANLASTHFQRVPWLRRCAVRALTDYWGNDLEPISDAPEPEVCCQGCHKNKRCAVWTYSPSQKKCWLKDIGALHNKIRHRQDRMSGLVCAAYCPRQCRDNYKRWFMGTAIAGSVLALVLIGAVIHDINVLLSSKMERGKTEP